MSKEEAVPKVYPKLMTPLLGPSERLAIVEESCAGQMMWIRLWKWSPQAKCTLCRSKTLTSKMQVQTSNGRMDHRLPVC